MLVVRTPRWPETGVALLFSGAIACASAPAVPLETEAKSKPALEVAPELPPTPAELFEAYVRAMGGRARILRGNSYRAKGTLSVADQGIEGELLVYMAAPNKTLTVLQMPGFGEVREGFDGEVGWSIDPMSGPRTKSGDELRDLERRSELHYALEFQKFYREMRTSGRRVFGKQDCYRVELKTLDDRDEVLYFSVESGLLVGREAMTPTVMGDVRIVSHYEEYRKVDGLAHPVRVRQVQGASTSIISLDEVEENPAELPSFAPPAEVKALLDEGD